MPNVCVEVRIRPNSRNVLEFSGNKIVVGSKIFTFSKVHSKVPQLNLFNLSILPFVEKFIGGGNCSILAYGQTGSGKTYTMGLSHRYEQGIIQYSLDSIFKKGLSLTVSFIEIYNEEIYDLQSQSRLPLSLRAGLNEINIVGLKETLVTSYEEAIEILKRGSESRTTKSTKMNSESSRSHAIFTLSLCQKINDQIVESKLTFVDLAGSERLKRSECVGRQAKEAISINCGLLSLGNVINALYTNKSHIPFRDSKLTRILEKCLIGSTLLIACISGLQEDAFETTNTLKYASRAALISLNEKVHIENDKDKLIILNLKKEISKLKEENNRLRLQAVSRGMKNENIIGHPLVSELFSRLKLYESEEAIRNLLQNLDKRENVDNYIDSTVQNEIFINEDKGQNILTNKRSLLNKNIKNSIFSSNSTSLSSDNVNEKRRGFSLYNGHNTSGINLNINNRFTSNDLSTNSINRFKIDREDLDRRYESTVDNTTKILRNDENKKFDGLKVITSNQLFDQKIKSTDNTGSQSKDVDDLKEITSNPSKDLLTSQQLRYNSILAKASSIFDERIDTISYVNNANPEIMNGITKEPISDIKYDSPIGNVPVELNDQNEIKQKESGNSINSLLPNLNLKTNSKIQQSIITDSHNIENTCMNDQSTNNRKRTRLVSFDLEPKGKSSLFTPLKEIPSVKLTLIDEFENFNAISLLKHNGKLFFNCIDSKIRFYDGQVDIAVSDDSIRCLYSSSDLFYSSRSLLKVFHSHGRPLPVFAYKTEISALKIKENLIFTGHDDGTVNILDRRSNELIFNEKLHKSTVFDICIMEDCIYTCSRDHSVKYSLMDNLSFTTLSPPHYDTVSSLIPFKDKCVSVSRDSSIKVWNGDRPFKTVPYAHDSWIKSAVTMDNLFMTGCKNGVLKCWNLTDQSIRCVGKIDVGFSINCMTEFDNDVWISCQNKKIQRYSVS